MVESRCLLTRSAISVVGPLILSWGCPSDGLEQPPVIEPVDPLERRVLDVVDVAPRPAPPDHLGLVQAVDGLGERVVVRVADRADRALEPGRRETFGVADRRVLRSTIAVHDGADGIRPCVQRLLTRRA